ncbi:F-box protein At3g07870-like [Corylus avellana]|uniref:F-box protein At3g07870-like n=1 Tax=Corylus avellana TaxID=13451 RepID=UPI00286A856E|nr:F-box protein At3g07870-like [Corylus avellana]
MSTYLPEEVLVKILSRLPTKSLIRFRCVSKTWHEIIGNPDFLYHSILTTTEENPNHPLLLIKATENSIPRREVLSFLSYENLEFVSQTPLTPGLKLIASCNDLLCLGSYFTSDVYVWNPTSPSVELEPLPPLTHRLPYHVSDVFGSGLGFGYDSRSNDFKVVRIRIIKLPTFVHQTKRIRSFVEVYSLSGGSWRVLDIDVFSGVENGWRVLLDLDAFFAFENSLRTVALDGVFIWWVPENIIAAFDFNNEVLRTTPLPDGCSLSNYRDENNTITLLNGHISLLAFSRSKMNAKCDLEIWVLLEFGVKESWTRLSKIGLSMDLERPLEFWKRGELFMVNSEGQLVLYDPFTHTKKNLQVYGIERTFQIVLHTPSSVAVEGGVNL